MSICRKVMDGVLLLAFAAATAAAPIAAQTGATAQVDATALVRQAVQHRLDASRGHRPMRYTLHVHDERHDTTKEIFETRDGDVARLVAVNGKPLTAEADRAELARLDNLAAHPELQEHRKRGEQKDAARVDRLMAMLPDALVYRLEGTVACGAALAVPAQCYRVSFAPNPRWSPPDMEADLLRGVAGEVWIDQTQERLTRLDARFIKDVDFGFGLLGKLYKGGTVMIEQTDVGGGDWELTGLTLQVSGKALLVKGLSEKIKEEASGFSPVLPMGYRDAIALLKKDGVAAPPQGSR
jgi:hypothetical protein